MKHARIAILSLLFAASAGCTKENAAFCCLTAEDCAAKGVTDGLRECADGLACVGNTCVAPTCSTDGCGTAAPVCDTTVDSCVGCTDSSECSRFPTTSVCNTSSGSCVECVSSSECSGTTPICDENVCRGCVLDQDCPSGACAEDGACIPDENIVFAAPNGQDVLPCSRAIPCASLQFAVKQVTETRNHVVLEPGTYTVTNQLDLPEQPLAATLALHGGGAIVEGGNADGFIRVPGAARINDLELRLLDPSGTALSVHGSVRLIRVKLRGNVAAYVPGRIEGSQVDMEVSTTGIVSSGTIDLDRVRIHGGVNAIMSYGTLNLTNALITGASGTAIIADGSNGTIAFTTIADSGAAVNAPPGVYCPISSLTIRSSIVWTRSDSSQAPVQGACAVVSSIVGPVGIVGASNANPLFVDSAAGDYHISGGSPARDMADVGPPLDHDGEPRPQGLRFDLGADESP